MQHLSPLAKYLFAPLPKLGQPEMTSVNLENRYALEYKAPLTSTSINFLQPSPYFIMILLLQRSELVIRYDTIRDAILTCARKPT